MTTTIQQQTKVILTNVYQKNRGIYVMYKGFLYDLLTERKPHQNISHKEMPTWKDHSKFVDKVPYKYWYIIEQQSPYYDRLGALYLTRGDEKSMYKEKIPGYEIGLFICKAYQGQGYGSKALKKFLQLHTDRPILANIAPKNFRSKKFFVKHGFSYLRCIEGIQDTYILTS